MISLKLARYDEFEEEIEKYKQDMTSSFDLFESVSSTDIFLEMSSTEIMIQSTTTSVTSATATKTLNQTTTVIPLPDTLTSKQPVLTSSESLTDLTTSKVPMESTMERTPSIKPTEKYSEVTTSEIPMNVTKKDIDIPTTDDVPKITSSEKPPVSISFTSQVLETPVPEIIVSSESSPMVDSAGVSSPPETFLEAKSTDVDVDLYVSSSSTEQDSIKITSSETIDDLSPSSSLPISDSPVVDKSDSELLPKSQIITQTYNNLDQTSSSDTKFPQSSFYTDMTIDAKSSYVDAIVVDPLPIQTSTVVISPSSTTDMKQSSTDDYHYGYDTDDYEDETSTARPLPGLDTSQTTDYMTETKPVVIVSPIVSEQSMSDYIDMYSHASKAIETVTSPTSSVSSVYVDIPSSTSPSEKDILIPSEPTTTSFDCTVIDATSYCPDTTSTTATLDSSSLIQKTKTQTDRMMETIFSSTPSSTLYYPIFIDIDKDGESSQPPTPTTDFTPYISAYPEYEYPDKYESYEYDDDDDDDKDKPMSTTPTTDGTPSTTEDDYAYVYPESYEFDDDDDDDTMENVDKEITGEIDIDEAEDYNEASNESGDTGEVVGKKAEEEEGGNFHFSSIFTCI